MRKNPFKYKVYKDGVLYDTLKNARPAGRLVHRLKLEGHEAKVNIYNTLNKTEKEWF